MTNTETFDTSEYIGKSKSVTSASKRIELLDYLKALAIILVVVNHSLSDAAKMSPLFYFLVRMAVPIFVLVTGFNYTYSIKKANSLMVWYKPKTLAKKLSLYLVPMIVVFLLYVSFQFVIGEFNIKALIWKLFFQTYGKGAYYFWIIVQLYLFFPIVYFITRRVPKGYLIVILLNILYEAVLFVFHINPGLYRIFAFRYITLLAMGSWINDAVNCKTRKRNAKQWITATALCVFGGTYIAFFMLNRDNINIFPYALWGNTNVFVNLYIVPIIFIIMNLFKDKKIPVKFIHNTVSLIGKSSYYIMCTQMVMFWFIGNLWGKFQVHNSVEILCNLIISILTGIFVYVIVERVKKGKLV